jgi:hypothetical protein
MNEIVPVGVGESGPFRLRVAVSVDTAALPGFGVAVRPTPKVAYGPVAVTLRSEELDVLGALVVVPRKTAL